MRVTTNSTKTETFKFKYPPPFNFTLPKPFRGTDHQEPPASGHSRFSCSLWPLACRWISEATTGGLSSIFGSVGTMARQPRLRGLRPAIAPWPEVAGLGSLRTGGRDKVQPSANGEAASSRHAPPREPPPMGVAGLEGGGQADRQSQGRAREHSPSSIYNSQSKAESRRPEDIQINSTSSLLPAPLRKRKKEGRGNRDSCQSLHKALPHPAQQPIAQQRTDKDIPWGRRSQSQRG